MSTPLTEGEKQTLLRIAREAIENAVKGKIPPPLDQNSLADSLRNKGASFVTLTIHGDLRGCIGALEAYQPLAEDVREHAVSAALDDPRFPPVSEAELSRIHIEVSRLTEPKELDYSTSDDLIRKLRPHIDGVILKHGYRKATFLPQVWEKIPDPVEFLEQLCYKMGERGNLWRNTKLQVYTYEVEEFHELN
jgi:AmmeMemoRadiSam system protein A